MSYDNWEDELLNFDYSNPVPQDRPKTEINKPDSHSFESPQQVEEAIRREETRAQRLQEEYRRLREASRVQQEEPVEIPRRRPAVTEEQHSANMAAQQEAYRQFREEYADKKPSSDKLNSGSGRASRAGGNAARKTASRAANAAGKVSGFYKFTKILSIPYVLLLAVFAVAMTLMNVLPFLWWVAMLVVLGLLSVIVVAQLRKNNIKKWAKVLSTMLAVVLMFFYGLGTVYALGTLSFLDKTSVKNENKVAHITKEPFNVLITGMDVWGKIDEQGRSDVNMMVTVNPETEQILMTSIPRDYQITVPDTGGAIDKLTHTGFYGVETTIGAVEDLLDTKANYYVKVNFSTIVKFIDAVGGLDFNNEVEFTSAITGHVYEKGMIHVQGRGALYYARERKAFMEGDNQRIKNQQLIFSEMLKKATSSKTMLLSYNKILSELDDYFEMSLSSREIRSLLKLQLAKNINWKMFKNTVVGGNGSMGTYSTGSTKVYVMTQDPYSIANAQELIKAVLNGQKLTKDKETDTVIIKEAKAEGE